MLHELGYSVAMLGKENVKEIKNTYLLSDSSYLDPLEIRPFTQDRDLLFAAASRLDSSAISKLAAAMTGGLE
jgi:hypothetical protein